MSMLPGEFPLVLAVFTVMGAWRISRARAAAARSSGIGAVAYFSMEFGLGEALPLYAGGLGILAGDVLKTGSDLGLPIVGIGLLYQSGYFRQLVDSKGWQQEILPYNEPASLLIEPLSKDGDRVVVKIELPGRLVRLRVWRARVGCVDLYLLDSNDPLNHPLDRGITGQLYGGGSDLRLMQEVVLGVGGWRLLESIGLDVEICHINEGHAAFAVLERARQFMRRAGVFFTEAFWATRAGNVDKERGDDRCLLRIGRHADRGRYGHKASHTAEGAGHVERQATFSGLRQITDEDLRKEPAVSRDRCCGADRDGAARERVDEGCNDG